MALSTLKKDGTGGTATVELTYENGKETRRRYGCIVKNDANLKSFIKMYIKQSADKTKFKESKYFVCIYDPDFEEKRNEATVRVFCHRFSKPSQPKESTLDSSPHNFVKVQGHIFFPIDSKNFNDSTFLEKHSKKILEAQDLLTKVIFGLTYDKEKHSPKFIPLKLDHQLPSNVHKIGATVYEKLEDAGPVLLQDNKTVVGSLKKRGNNEISISIFGNNQEITTASSTDGAPGDEDEDDELHPFCYPKEHPRHIEYLKREIHRERGRLAEEIHRERRRLAEERPYNIRLWNPELDKILEEFGKRAHDLNERLEKENTIPSEILARGPEALTAYEEALESGKTKNRCLLVMVVGSARAGKTSLLKSLNGEEFDPKEDSTDGIQLQRTFCKSQENCWSKESDKGISYADCMADIIHKDLQGGDDSEEIHDENLAKARKESIEKSVESSESLSKNDDDDRDEDHDAGDDADEDDEADDDNDAHGNDDDKINAIKVDCEEINEEAKELENQEYISEKSTANLPKSIEEKLLVKLMDTELSDNRENEVYIKSLDFAGQAVYNVINPIFLTSKAVLILVYNLKNRPHDIMKSIVEEDGAERELVDPFEMTNLENLELWLSCISSYTDTQRMAKIGGLSLPPVFIAGTHADEFDGNLEAAKKIIREIYKSLSPSKNPSGCHVKRNQIYTVNNSVSGNGEINDESVRRLKADIEELAKSLPHMNEDIPVNWLWFEEELSNLVEKGNKKYITIDEALKIANECKVNTSAESKEFLTLLNYLHDLKIIIYFEETKKVFIDTEWLVKVFTKVIEVRPVEKRDGFDVYWDKLEEEGVLDRALVEHVWKGLVDEQNTIDSLLLIMEKFSLICRWNTSEGEEVYLVPCMLCNSKKREDIAKCLEHEKSSTMVIRCNTSHVSLGIFPRLFVAIAEEGKKIWPNLRQPTLHKNIFRFSKIGKERNLDICIIQSSFQTISVTVCNKQNIDGQRVTEFCQHFRKLLDQIFGDMRRNFPWMQNMTFEYGILCPVCTSSPNKCKSHEIEGCSRDTCLHFVNEEELSIDKPECEKDVAMNDNVIEEKAYAYWFPRQAHQPQVEEFGRCENFALDYEHQVPVSDLQEFLTKMKHSIGAIIAINTSEVPECGATCFRIGTKYVITNKHVVDDISKLGIQSWSRCRVDFNYKEQVPQPAASFLFNFAPNPVRFYSEDLDYVILELLSNGEDLPLSVTELGYNIAPPGRQLKSGECLTFIGHPGGGTKLIDGSCPIKLQQDIQKHLRNYDASAIASMLKACDHPDHVTYDVSTFFKGASGSPGILMKKKLLVVLHRGGFENRALEYGILMSSVVKDVMAKIENVQIQNVLDDIFGGSTSSIFYQCSSR